MKLWLFVVRGCNLCELTYDSQSYQSYQLPFWSRLWLFVVLCFYVKVAYNYVSMKVAYNCFSMKRHYNYFLCAFNTTMPVTGGVTAFFFGIPQESKLFFFDACHHSRYDTHTLQEEPFGDVYKAANDVGDSTE